MVDPKKGTQKLFVKETVGTQKNVICAFRGSKVIYGDGTIEAALSPADATGVARVTDALGSGFPVYDTAQLLRAGVIADLIISYKDGEYTKSQRVIVANSKVSSFMKAANAGTLTFNSKKVTSAAVSQTAFSRT